jgi:N-formylglutamate amidohydrolase
LKGVTTTSKSLQVFPGSPEVAGSPLVLSVPHAGLLVPAEDAALLAVSGKGLLKDADLHVDRLVQRVPALGVPVVVAQISRYVLDVNRAPDDVDREVCPEIDRPARPSARGLCWRTTTDGAAVLVRPLTLAELRSRLQRIHEPYHETLAELLRERRRRFGYAVLLDVHSMPSLGRPGHTDPGARRADIVPGDLRGTSCSPLLSRLVADHFAGAGLSVRANDPYMGGYVTKQHGRPARGVHALQVELNRDLYMDEASFALVDDRAAVVTGLLLALVEKVKALALPS